MSDPHAELLAHNRAAWAARPWWERIPWGATAAVVAAPLVWALHLAPLVALFWR